ncbi:MAG: hypothetical protein ABSC64_07885 [Candidatus Korobacteraceae bacterium]|jgi:hypothetical protein
MFLRACLGVLLLLPTYVWSQADTNGTEAAANPGYDVPMRTPPPVSGEAYSTAFASETESNNLRAGLTMSTAYSNNVLGGDNPVSSMSYSIWPTLALDADTTRLHWVLNYSPGFTFYQSVSARNQSDQTLAADFQYRLSPHLTASLQDSFQKTSNLFNQPNPLSAIAVSGSAPAPNVAVIAPLADQVSNTANAQLTYQLSADSMVGVSGTFTNLNYPNPADARGLFDSSSTGGSAFYSRRLMQKYDVGVSYQYSDISSYQAGGPSSTQTQTQTVFLFFTAYLKPTLSLSLSGGPQHYDASQPPLPASGSWSPLVMASLGWQGQRTSLAASYSRIVTSGGGLTGAYHANTANVSGRWQLSRTWSAGLSAGYWLYQTLTPFFLGSSSGGHTVSGTASVQHPLGEHLSVQAGYTRIQQNYSGIAAISAAPGINQEFVSISYQFTRPLKR